MKRALLLAVAFSATVVAGPFPNDDKTIEHVLNRIGFGARPGDVERVRAMGLERYIDQQLHPERIDDAAVKPRLGELATIGKKAEEIEEKYDRPVVEALRERKQNDGDPTPEMRALQQKAQSVVLEMGEQKILRAVYSERQLQEVLADFWFNHCNVDARKGRTRGFITEYEREAIRPHVFGKFRDLLEATAKSPAMLFYLDNWMSADPNGPHQVAGGRFPMGRRFGGRPGPVPGAPPARPRFQVPPRGPPPRHPRGRRGPTEAYGRETGG